MLSLIWPAVMPKRIASPKMLANSRIISRALLQAGDAPRLSNRLRSGISNVRPFSL
jgi:hypothetical protein